MVNLVVVGLVVLAVHPVQAVTKVRSIAALSFMSYSADTCPADNSECRALGDLRVTSVSARRAQNELAFQNPVCATAALSFCTSAY